MTRTRTIAASVLLAFGVQGAFAQTQAPAPVDAPVELRFDIRRYVVEGNTLLPQGLIDGLVGAFTGGGRDFGDVQRALEALENAYRERGFSAVQVFLPEQRLERGEVLFRVIEARIRRVEVQGNKFFDEANVRASLPSMTPGRTPNANDVARNLRIVNENAAKQTNVTLRSGENDGEVDALVEVTDEKPSRVFMTLDNTGTGQTGYHRLGFGYQHSNLFNRDHAITLQYITSVERPKRVGIYSAGYHVPLYAWGSSIDAYLAYSDVSAGSSETTAGTLTFSGAGGVAGIRFNRHLDRVGALEHRLVFGLDYKNYRNNCSLGTFGAAGCGTASATFTLIPASLTYAGSWTHAQGQAGYYVTAIANLPLNNDSDTAALGRARFLAKGDGKILKLGVNYAHALESDWQFRARFDAQYANEELSSPDQFGIGGSSSVRGFLERERADDRGHFGSVEAYTPDLAPRFSFSNWNIRVLTFYDIGRTSRVNPQPGEQVHNGLASAGFGLRLTRGKDFSFRADLAQILDPGGTRERNHWRGHFSATLSF